MSSRAYRVDTVPWNAGREPLSAIRREVFVREQGVSEAEEWDGLDAQCTHVLARDRHGTPIGCARLLPDGRIGRMAVLREWRGRGVGAALLRALLTVALAHGGPRPWLQAQEHALGFYRRLGFVARGPRFLDAGIPHREMVLSTFDTERGHTR